MSRSIPEICDFICQTGIVPVFSHRDFDVNCRVMEACAKAGLGIFEFTNRVDDAVGLFARLREVAARDFPDMLFGAGTVRRPDAAKQFCDAGAQFIVGPIFHMRIATVCLANQIPYSPGCATPTELERAQEVLGENAVLKCFPGSFLGAKFVSSVLATNPTLRLMITGGVKPALDSLTEWFGAGAAAVGIGSELISKELIAANDWEGLTASIASAKELVAEVKAARK